MNPIECERTIERTIEVWRTRSLFISEELSSSPQSRTVVQAPRCFNIISRTNLWSGKTSATATIATKHRGRQAASNKVVKLGIGGSSCYLCRIREGLRLRRRHWNGMVPDLDPQSLQAGVCTRVEHCCIGVSSRQLCIMFSHIIMVRRTLLWVVCRGRYRRQFCLSRRLLIMSQHLEM